MKLSIITINYNNAAGLKATLDSVVVQTFREFEHIIVDGGSTDGSIEVIEEYVRKVEGVNESRNEGIHVVWSSEPDNGIYDAMNKGIEKASGEYLYFLNGGDTLVDKFVFELLSKKLNQGEDIIVSKINFVDANGKYHADFQPRMSEISLFHFLQAGIPHQSALIHRSLFQKYGLYDLQYSIVADWEFFLRALILNNATLRYTDITIANFDGTGLTSTHGKEMMDEIAKVISNSFPRRVVLDYQWMQSNVADMRRVEWLQHHPFVHKMVNALVGVGRKIFK